MMLTSASCVKTETSVLQGTAPKSVIDMSEEQINIKIVQMVEKFPVTYNYSPPGHSNEEEVDKAWHAVSKELNIDGKCTHAPC
jgi:hypothetical protein